MKIGNGPDQFEGWKHRFQGHVNEILVEQWPSKTKLYDCAFAEMWASLCEICEDEGSDVRFGDVFGETDVCTACGVVGEFKCDTRIHRAKIRGIRRLWWVWRKFGDVMSLQREGGGRFAEHVFRKHIAWTDSLVLVEQVVTRCTLWESREFAASAITDHDVVTWWRSCMLADQPGIRTA